MALIGKVIDNRVRKCWKCGRELQIGDKYARTRRQLMPRPTNDLHRTSRGWRLANCKYYCRDCYVDGRGNPLI